MKLSTIIEILHPKIIQTTDNEAIIKHLCFDSRKIHTPEGTLFFAFRTATNDGHRYIAELLRQGVRNFILTDPAYMRGEGNFLLVEDVGQAMQALATAKRRLFNYPVIGITGSNGKTIVKEWIATLLAESRKVVKSPDSYNSQIGVPMSVWQMSDNDDIAIFEAGISKPGEMERLSRIIAPNIGILTNIGMAHDQYFENSQQKAAEKLLLFKASETLIYRDNNPMVNRLLETPKYRDKRKVSWGSSDAAYPVRKLETQGHITTLSLGEEIYHIPFVDAASIENATHAIVTLLVLGFEPAFIEQRLSRLTRISMRTEILEGAHHSILINDTYSLDINALYAALELLSTQTQLPNKALIISDFEQVTLTPEDYIALNARFQRHNIRRLIAVGESFYANRDRFTLPEARFYRSTEALLAALPDFTYEAILIKGARSFHFEKIVSRLQHKTHLTILNVNLRAISHNLSHHRAKLKPGTKMVAMVKANCYGLGDAEIINELVQQGIDYLAVAYTDEGVRLRKRHIATPIIVLGAEAHSFDVMVQHQLEPEIFNFYYLNELSEVLRKFPHIQRFNIHIKLDTGMHRLGFDETDLPELIRIVQRSPQLRIASVFSHLAAAEDPAEDAYTRQQIERFQRMSDTLRSAFDYPILRHILNSAGITRFPDAQFDMVRLGISMYGCAEIPEVAAALHHVVTLTSVVTQVKMLAAGETIGYNRAYRLQRDTQVAIIPIGYADGYPRELGNGRGVVIIHGQRVPIIGKVCMDMCMADVTGLNVHEGDEIVIYGEGNTVSDMARAAGLISYELMTRISQRVPRVYVRE